MLTYEEVINFARDHYSEGGDGVYECLSRKDYEQEISEGREFTERSLLKEFKIYKSICDEYKSMADW